MDCDCREFREELLNLSKEILTESDGMSQWKIFEQFLTKYVRDDTHDGGYAVLDGAISDSQVTTMCSQEICAFLDHNLAKFRIRDVSISTILVDTMTILYLSDCTRSHMQYAWNFETHQITSRDREILVFRGALFQDQDFMKLLLKFGFLSSLSGDSPFLTKLLGCVFHSFISLISNGISNTDYITGKAMKLLKDSFYFWKKGEFCKRMFLSVIAICAIQGNLYEDYSFAEQFIGCLRMHFTATRDAFLSVFEVRSVLYASFKLTNKLHFFHMNCQEFDRLMPECPAKIEPRKLTHLVRCQIRDNLKGSHLPLPSAIERLFSPNLLLPMSLKNFLLGEVNDISRSRAVTDSELALLSERSSS